MDPQAYNSPISVTSSPHHFIHIKHSQANLQLGLLDCPAKPIHNWVYQAAGNQDNTLLGLSGYLDKPTNSWVYQTTGSQANTIHFHNFHNIK